MFPKRNKSGDDDATSDHGRSFSWVKLKANHQEKIEQSPKALATVEMGVIASLALPILLS